VRLTNFPTKVRTGGRQSGWLGAVGGPLPVASSDPRRGPDHAILIAPSRDGGFFRVQSNMDLVARYP